MAAAALISGQVKRSYRYCLATLSVDCSGILRPSRRCDVRPPSHHEFAVDAPLSGLGETAAALGVGVGQTQDLGPALDQALDLAAVNVVVRDPVGPGVPILLATGRERHVPDK